jgi:hypothetical protein
MEGRTHAQLLMSKNVVYGECAGALDVLQSLVNEYLCLQREDDRVCLQSQLTLCGDARYEEKRSPRAHFVDERAKWICMHRSEEKTFRGSPRFLHSTFVIYLLVLFNLHQSLNYRCVSARAFLGLSMTKENHFVSVYRLGHGFSR